MKAKTRVAVLVSGGGTNLQALIDAQAAGRLPDGELCAVISNKKGAFALTRAEKAGIPAFTVTKKASGGSQEAFEAALNDVLDASLIPAFCGKGYYGLRVHEAALERGVKVTGATVHLVNEIPDGGRILLQKAVEILPGDTAETLQRRVMEQAEWILLPQAVELLSKQLREEDSSHD